MSPVSNSDSVTQTTGKMTVIRFAIGLILSAGLISQVFAQGSPADSLFVLGEVYVQLADGLSPRVKSRKIGSSGFDHTAEKYGFYAVNKSFPSLNKIAYKTDKFSDLESIYTVYFDENHSPVQVASALSLDPNVIYAEPKLIRFTQYADLITIPDDPLFETYQSKYFELLHLPEAWDIVKGEQGDALIAIVDDGVYWKHEDLLANVWTNPQEVPSNGIDDDQNGYVDDVHGYDFGQDRPYDPGEFIHPDHGEHGTAVAAVAVAVTDNGIGMSGSSWNARFISIGTQCDFGGGICDASEAIVYAATLGADIINASFGGPGYSRTESLVIQAASDMGSLVIAAAGNEGWNVDWTPSYPADYPRVLSVGGTSNDFDMVFFNYGTNVDVYAAGMRLTAPYQGDYSHGWRGTSFSTPLVSGVAALVKTAFPSYGADQIREQIRFTSDPIESSNIPEFEGLLGFGRVNAFRAVTETDIAGVVLDTVEIGIDGNGWHLGSTGHVNVRVHSYLRGAGDVEVRIIEAPDAIEFTERTLMVGNVPSGDSKTVALPFTVTKSPKYRTTELYVIEVQSGDEVQRKSIQSPIEGWEIKGVTGEQLAFDVTSEGNIGFLDRNQVYLRRFSHGRGIHFKGAQHLLNEAGLILGTGPHQVSRSVVGIERVHNNIHFRPKPNTGIKIQSPGKITPWEAEVKLLDTKSPNPTGLEVRQKIYFDPEGSNSSFAILHYIVSNATSSPVKNLHIGMLFDWIISEFRNDDLTGYDLGRDIGYQYTEVEQRPGMGAKVLTSHADKHFTVYDSGIYPFPHSEWAWWFMSEGVESPPSFASYWGQVFGTGPYTMIQPGDSVEAAFAFFGGDSIDDILLNGDRAQAFWDSRLGTQAQVQFLRIDSEMVMDIYVNHQRIIEHWQPEAATKFMPLDSGDSVIELRYAGDSKTSEPIASTTFHLNRATSYHMMFSGLSSQFIRVADARQVAISPEMIEFRAMHTIMDAPDVELRVLHHHSHDQIITVHVPSGGMSNYVTLPPNQYLMEVWDLFSDTRLGSYHLIADSYAGRTFVLMINGSLSSGVDVKSVLSDGTELGSSAPVSIISSTALPSELSLRGNFPNPFNGFTQIHFDLPTPAYITVDIIDLIGRRVWKGKKEYMDAGHDRYYSIRNHSLVSGVYLYRLVAETTSKTMTQSGQFVVVK